MHTPPPALPALRRRSVLATLGLGALGAVPPLRAQSSASTPPEVWRAVSRVGYGPTPALLATVRQQGARSWALQQVDVARTASQTAPAIPADYAHILQPLPALFEGARKERESAKFRRENAATKPDQPLRIDRPSLDDPTQFSRAMAMGTAAWHLRSSSDPALEPPLLARMTEFWFNHFNVYVGKGAVRPFIGHYLVHAIRTHALGRFEDLVFATARHPAMLHYLDQWQSVAEGSRGPEGKTRGLNENYARELMELHTLGVHGGYTQTDVRELARILTGWTIGPQEASGFRFAPRMHDNGTKTLLGQRYGGTGNGEQEGVDAIRALVRHPSTAQRVCLRLAQFFVSDTPPDALVQQLVRSFTQSQGDIAQVLRTLLQSSEFWAPENQLFKTPLDFTCSAMAATQTGSDPRVLLHTFHFLNQAGQPLHGWQTPDGYRFDAATWRVPEALTRRADFALLLARNSDTRYLLPYLSERTVQTITHEAPALQSGLILASPEFQWK
ncbi:DUF1800 domain-containing protein [Curvibacter sp. APW13]|uniref:DUF1800 domain-containing protein n=1 Tax=Curvibacter sp. APW13 TaxID=3077236 RepID=UPI0028DEE562|nr:DUF1800 domain-containing protein [Curvibacter sp. APW13]MDT8992570.1 DUF1800 domain-containing protein [Curvibacter sp. APW13]